MKELAKSKSVKGIADLQLADSVHINVDGYVSTNICPSFFDDRGNLQPLARSVVVGFTHIA